MTTILLADDEKLVQRSLEKTLLRAGFEVLTASDCPSGLELFQANLAAIDLAVFDLNMPGFEGLPKPGAGLDLLERIGDAHDRAYHAARAPERDQRDQEQSDRKRQV